MAKINDIDNPLVQEHDLLIDGSFLGIDLSLRSTGYGIVDVNHCRSWRACPPDSLRGAERLCWHWNQVWSAVNAMHDSASNGPFAVVVEGYAMAKAQGAHQAGELGGVARMALYRAGVPWGTAQPGSLKKFIKGRGDGPKEGVSMYLLKVFGLEVEQPDEADAVSLALMGAALACPPFRRALSVGRRDALRKVNIPGLVAPSPRVRRRLLV